MSNRQKRSSLIALEALEELAAIADSEHVVFIEAELNRTQAERKSHSRLCLPIVGFFLNPDFSLNRDTKQIEDTLSSMGVGNDSLILAHGKNMAISAFVYWFFKLVGHENVAVVNAGRKPIPSYIQNKINPTDYKITEQNLSNWISKTDVKKAIEATSARILDARTVEEYSGLWYTEGPPLEGQRTGRIPTAEHFPHDAFLNEAGQIDILKAQEIAIAGSLDERSAYVCYCAAGFRSALVWFVLTEVLGFPYVKNYSGSWVEWSSDETAPVVKTGKLDV